MSIVRVTEITASSTKGFEDAVCKGIQRAGKNLGQYQECLDSGTKYRR